MKSEKKQTITKFRAYATIDREEVFLNEMISKGWKPVKIILGLWFVFEKCQPGEYIARVTTCVDPKGSKAGKARREQLTDILTESGAEIIPETNLDAGTRIYAVRRSGLGEFEINTDIDSLISEYTGRRRYHVICAALLLACFVLLVFLGYMMVKDYLADPSDSYPLTSACLEFVCAAVELLCVTVLFLPVPGYSAKLRELREKREIQE